MEMSTVNMGSGEVFSVSDSGLVWTASGVKLSPIDLNDGTSLHWVRYNGRRCFIYTKSLIDQAFNNGAITCYECLPVKTNRIHSGYVYNKETKELNNDISTALKKPHHSDVSKFSGMVNRSKEMLFLA